MADNNTDEKRGNLVLAGMVALLVLLILGFAGNFYLQNSGGSQNGHIEHANELKVISQKIAKHTASAALGNTSVFRALTDDRADFESHLNMLRNGDPGSGLAPAPAGAGASLNQISSLWSDLVARVEVIVNNQDALSYLKETSADMNITMSAIQQENNKVVRALLRANTAANEIVMAQRQALLIERMSHSIDKVLERGDIQGLRNNFSRDGQTFRQVLLGLKNGDRGLVLTAVADRGVQESLSKIEELFSSVTQSSPNILARSDEVLAIRNAADAIYGGSSEFIVAGDALLEALGAGSGGLSFASPQIGIGFGGAIIVVFVVITLLVNRRSNTSISETSMQNEENQAAILQLLDGLHPFFPHCRYSPFSISSRRRSRIWSGSSVGHEANATSMPAPTYSSAT